MVEVFYRKWRPQRLDQVVGQEHVVQTLRKSVERGKTSHAYIFCGPRGTGKTSTARVLAKALNCESPVGGEPDDSCDSCVAIRQSRALDLIEIDAASNRGIDDIRSLKEKVHFAPNSSRNKVYIIDEVHMLTEPAFNALLKTLEEPPPHSVFILATTEVHKVPLTVISRCQRFDFRRIPLEDATSRLARLCEDEGVEAENEALSIISRSSTGSLRDAENLLEQALVSYGSPLLADQVRDLLGLRSDEEALELVGCIFSGSVKDGLNIINQVAGDGGDLRQFQRVLVEHLRSALLMKSGVFTSLGYTEESKSRLEIMVAGVSIRQVVQVLDRFIDIDQELDSTSPLPLELALVECSFAIPETSDLSTTPSQQETIPSELTVTETAQKREDHDKSSQVLKEVELPDPAPTGSVGIPTEPTQRLDQEWNAIVGVLRKEKGKRFNLGALLRSSAERVVDGDAIILRYSHVSHLERMREELGDPRSTGLIQKAFETAMGRKYEIRAQAGNDGRNGTKVSVAQRSHLVRAAQMKGARVISEKEDLGDDEQKDAAPGSRAPEEHGKDAGGA